MEAIWEKILPYLLPAIFGIIATICGGHWRRYIRIAKEIGDVFEELHKAYENDGKVDSAESKKIWAEAIEAYHAIRGVKKGEA